MTLDLNALVIEIHLETRVPLPENPSESKVINTKARHVVQEMMDRYEAKMGQPFPVTSIDVNVDMGDGLPIKVTVKGRL